MKATTAASPPSPLRQNALTPSAQQGSDKGKNPASLLLPSKEGSVVEDMLPWVEKYRPTHLEELISHTDIISTITRFMDQNTLPHLLFYGPPGTGKTSTILACARRLYGPKYKSMILELNASDDRGIDVVREQIKNFASTKKIFSTGFKLIILDEADAMTQAAQNALRRIVEKYTKNVRFCIICNYVSKIIPALQSRCTRFRFAPLKEDQIRSRLEFVAEREAVALEESGCRALLKLSNGDMRRMLNILQAVHAAYDTVTEENVFTCVGSPLPADMTRIAEWLFNEDFEIAYTRIITLKKEKGLALSDIVTELHGILSAMELPHNVRAILMSNLAETEYRLSVGCVEKYQVSSLVAAFRLAVELATRS
ncbi:putative RFC3-DNA replication factor C, 40 kDa subunit [Zopfochytrium polystomum]|nr:putative RFC3-DNA replication factor C, 40 kDa subunit [Zopfochytrium polystomum]